MASALHRIYLNKYSHFPREILAIYVQIRFKFLNSWKALLISRKQYNLPLIKLWVFKFMTYCLKKVIQL